MLNAKTKDGSRNLEIMLQPAAKKDLVVAVDLLKKTCFDVGLNMDFNRDNSFRQQKELGFNPEKGNILLQGVDIVENKTSAFSRSWGAYPWADKTVTVTKDDYGFKDILLFLVTKVGGVRFEGDNITMVMNGDPPLFMLDGLNLVIDDENQAILKEILSLRMKDIDIVDILRPNLLNKKGVIAIYRKPYALRVQRNIYDYVKGRAVLTPKGFHRAIKFYSPQYTLENRNNPKPDYRPTLFWDPDVSFVNGKANLDFFTSDEATDYVVYLEGISKNGKICYGTTNFTVK
jgi:hypothetical protein